jgi:hypothetical protein
MAFSLYRRPHPKEEGLTMLINTFRRWIDKLRNESRTFPRRFRINPTVFSESRKRTVELSRYAAELEA